MTINQSYLGIFKNIFLSTRNLHISDVQAMGEENFSDEVDSFVSCPEIAASNQDSNVKPNNDKISKEVKRIIESEKIDLEEPTAKSIMERQKRWLSIYTWHVNYYKGSKAPIPPEVSIEGLKECEPKLEVSKKTVESLEKILTPLEDEGSLEDLKNTISKEIASKRKVLEMSQEKETITEKEVVSELEDIINEIQRFERAKKILEIRARYNLTGNLNELANSLPYREAISSDPQKLAKYDDLLKLVLESADIGFSTDRCNFLPSKELEGVRQAEISSKYIAVDYVVGLLLSKPEVLEKALRQDNKLKIRVTSETNGKPDSAFYYDPYLNMIVFNFKSLSKDFNNSTNVVPPGFLYTFTHDANVFNSYFPYRASIADNEDKVIEYNNLMGKIISLKMRFFPMTYKIKEEGPTKEEKNKILILADADKFVIAATITELIHNNLESLLQTAGFQEGLNIVLVHDFENFSGGGNAAGIYDGRYHTLFIKSDPNLEQFIEVVAHEYAHSMDGADKERVGKIVGSPFIEGDNPFAVLGNVFRSLHSNCDGILALMGPENRRELIDARDELFQRVSSYVNKIGTDEARREARGFPKTPVPTVGLSYYAFENETEFLAETVCMFCFKPEALYKASPKLYRVYTEFFKFDPLELRKKAQFKKAA